MAIKKSELYSSLWASCDELRGGMDASQYKDYVLTLLFVKYVSDKYANRKNSLIVVPNGATFEDMVALKGKTDIGDRINKQILAPLFQANQLDGAFELVDFNDDERLGSGKEKVERLSNLVSIFENPALNFKNNRAEDDDILGDAYEFLMRHFATESGKSKGQFYTPSEVSRVMAKIIDVQKAERPSFTVYDPTCGSGSLLLKVAEESKHGLSIYGQEKDIATKGLAIMNMWLHGHPEAAIGGKNTIADPQFKETDGRLKRFDYVVANPPFSVKNWSNGIIPMEDEFKRFVGYGEPPAKNGDYAFLLHIIASMKSTGKAAVILPHGVLFRGNSEGIIRQRILQRRLIKGIIGLPPNLFYGTGIPACIIVLDKEGAEARSGIFMIDASKGFRKDGNKNRLREQDIHKIVDVFNQQWAIEKFSRMVSYEEIEQNEFNLNLPRYIDTQDAEDIQDLNGHLSGGIPERDIESLSDYWEVYPNLRNSLFIPLREGYLELGVDKASIKDTIFQHPEFKEYSEELNLIFESWKMEVYDDMASISNQTSPKEFIRGISESILRHYSDRNLVSRYDIYQHLLDYWTETMKDDVYLIIEGGWTAKVDRIVEKNKDKGWICELLPKELVIRRYLNADQIRILEMEIALESVQAQITEYEEEHGVEEGLLAEASNEKGKLTKNNITQYMKSIAGDASEQEALNLCIEVLELMSKEASLKKDIKQLQSDLNERLLQQYLQLTDQEVQILVVEEKWLRSMQLAIQAEVDGISQRLTTRVKELAGRYEHTLPQLNKQVHTLEQQVAEHLQKMGLAWTV